MFNAPPRAGKDTACEILMRKFPESVKYEYFKEYLYKESAKVLGLDFNFWASVCQNGDLKDKPMLRLQTGEAEGSVTPRDILINVAENILKPKHGKDCIANATAHKIAKTIQQFKAEKGYNPIIVVPDLGFPYEADAVRTIIPSAEVAVVHIKREGYTFEGYRNADGSVGTKNLLGISTHKVCHSSSRHRRSRADLSLTTSGCPGEKRPVCDHAADSRRHIKGFHHFFFGKMFFLF